MLWFSCTSSGNGNQAPRSPIFFIESIGERDQAHPHTKRALPGEGNAR
jgi:hypothetical protein